LKKKAFTDIFIKRPVLSIVVSLFILVMGLRSIGVLPIQQFPSVESAVIQIQTTFQGADPATIASFITTPLENAIAQTNGIDYMTSSSTQNTSMILANLLLNWDPDKALTEISAQVSTVLNQLPKNSQLPQLTVSVAQSIDPMYIGYYSNVLPSNAINDYLLRVVQPKVQAVHGVQQAQILGQRQYAMRVWLEPSKMAGFHVTPAEVGAILQQNDFVTAGGRTNGQMYVLNFSTSTPLHEVEEFKNLIIKSENGALVRIKDIAQVTLGAQNYDTAVKYDKNQAVYIGITVAPGANILNVLDNVQKVYRDIEKTIPNGIKGAIVYNAEEFIRSSIVEVNASLLEAFVIVSVVVFIFLSSIRSLFIPIIAIPLSIVGTFFVMFLLNYSINLLTLLALVLAIGLVVDDAIIVVENVHRHIDDGKSPFEAALLSARELTQPIIAITVVLIAVYLPIGFMTGLTGALFTEFAFTLAGAVTVSAVIALTLSPMMCSKFLKPAAESTPNKFTVFIDKNFDRFKNVYEKALRSLLKYLPVVIVFAVIILASNYFLFVLSSSELAPQEDQGIIMAQLTSQANASLYQTMMYSDQVTKIFKQFPQTEDTFQINGVAGANLPSMLNTAIAGMNLVPWDKRKKTTNQLQPVLQEALNHIAGAQVAAFQPPSLPGGGSGLPIQFVVQTTEPFSQLNIISEKVMEKALASGDFAIISPDLQINKQQAYVDLNRAKIAQFGLTMEEVGNTISNALSENYVNYFDYMGRSYQVIPQVTRQSRLNDTELYNYYIKTAQGNMVPLSTVAKIKYQVVPQTINHFQQLNSVTFSAVPAPGVSMGDALHVLQRITQPMLPDGYTIDYGGQSRQLMQEGSSLLITFFFALIIIYLALSVLFNSFRDPFIVLISVPMSICGAMIFICLSVGGANLNIYTEVGLVTLIGLISKHGILITQFANDLQLEGVNKFDAIAQAASIRFRPILMTTFAMVLGVIPLIIATGAGAVSRYDIGLVIATGISIGTCFTLFVVPAMYMLLAKDYRKIKAPA